MIDTQRFYDALRGSGAPNTVIGFANVNRTTLPALLDGTDTDPFTFDPASLIAAFETLYAPSGTQAGVILWAQTIAYYYTQWDVLSNPAIGSVDYAAVQAMVATATGGIDGRIDALETFKTTADGNSNNKVDPENQESAIHLEPTASDKWSWTHGLGRNPTPLVRNLLGEVVTPDEVEYPDTNTITIYFGVPQAGSAELI